jgi:hypothetical protein
MQLLERQESLPIRSAGLAAKLIEAHQVALDTQEPEALHAARIEALETLAMENYARL